MEVHVLFVFILIHSIRLCYQQDISACPIGYEYSSINKTCVPQTCPNTHVLVNGTCHPKPSCGLGFVNISGICIQQNCQNNHVLVNGICHPTGTFPVPTAYCPNGYTLNNGLCYSNTVTVPKPCEPRPCGIFMCNTDCIPLTSTTTTTTETPDEKKDCPPDSVLIDGECRLIYCPRGTVHKGRCLEPVCSGGLVWTGSTCAQPETITTVLEIENTFVTDVNQTGPVFQQPQVINNVVYRTESYDTATEGRPCSTTEAPRPNPGKKCCIVITPRICKRYNSKWVCFNRQYRRCGDVCGNHTVIYLRIPKVIEQSSILLMPPNPPLDVCTDNDCSSKEHVDCSGCAINQRKSCSSYCYRYRCPEKRCTFIDQHEYCTKYSDSPGCSHFDGCFDEWCSNSNESPHKCY